MNEVLSRLSRCEAASLAMLERDLLADAKALLSALRVLVDTGRAEELDPVCGGHDADWCGELQARNQRFYRMIRDSDTLYRWELAVDKLPLNILARRVHNASLDANHRKGEWL